MAKIKKVEVSTGIYWVKVPEAGLFVLCGCPADSVKHLMKRGLIVPEEVDGVMTETGPNAILLSDSLVQNGEFANLAEFPVLQMLYRQGMLLPGHPNNTGQRPLLMGAEAQVRAQMRYIYHGNYGLPSEHAMTRAGVDLERASQEMRLKLRFAFGKIKNSSEFLDTLSIGDQPVEVRSGVLIERVAINVFEFSYAGESLQVDLNLPPGLGYESPYPLGSRRTGRDYFSVVHSGNGDGWDVNRPSMASILMYQGQVYLIDAGPNIRHSLHALGIGVHEIAGVFHTHAHDDHFCGLTTLMQADHRIKHLATPLVRASVAKKWGALLSRPESEFEQYFEPVDLKEGRWNDVEGLKIKPVFSPHPLETTILFFRAMGEDGWKSYAHLADITSRRVLESFLTDDDSAPGLSRETFERVWKDYLTPVTVKKVDIGGGLIHGEAQDFLEDRSGKIILSHTALPLTNQQKEIGSEASFGMVDVLIEGKQDFFRARAFQYLNNYLVDADKHDLRMLMNGAMVEFNPGDIILRRGQVPENIYLIVTGMLELLDSDIDIANHLGAGGMVGDMSGLVRQPSPTTYRAMTHVRALKLPRAQFSLVMKKGGRAERIARLRRARQLLEETWLFDGLSANVQQHIVSNMVEMHFRDGEMIDHPEAPAVFLLAGGEVSLSFDGREMETLRPGDFLGEGYVVFDTPCVTRGHARGPVDMFIIPARLVRHIPVVRWKLHETFRRRIAAIVDTVDSEKVFTWRDEFSTGIEKQDADHKQLMVLGNAIYELLGQEECDTIALDHALAEFMRFTALHFRREVEWYAEAGFPELAHHKVLHRTLLRDARRKMERIKNNCRNRDLEFQVFFKDWLIDHIIIEDRKFGSFMVAGSSDD